MKRIISTALMIVFLLYIVQSINAKKSFLHEEGNKCTTTCTEEPLCDITCIYESTCVRLQGVWVKCDGEFLYCNKECPQP